MEKTKVTFKKQPRNTGLYSIGTPNNSTLMKIKGKIFGEIVPPSWNSEHNGWVIRITIIKKDIMEDGNKNCIWRTIRFKGEHGSEDMGRIWVSEHIENIMSKYDLYFQSEDDY